MKKKLNSRFEMCSAFKGEEIDPMENEYGYFIDDDGVRKFGVIGKVDCVKEINAWRESTDYSLIMQQLNPVESAFETMQDVMEQYQGFDLSDPLVVVSLIESLKDDFKYLPVEVKEKYDNDVNVFARAAISGKLPASLAEQSQQLKQSAQAVSSPDYDSLVAEVQRLSKLVEQSGQTGSGSGSGASQQPDKGDK